MFGKVTALNWMETELKEKQKKRSGKQLFFCEDLLQTKINLSFHFLFSEMLHKFTNDRISKKMAMMHIWIGFKTKLKRNNRRPAQREKQGISHSSFVPFCTQQNRYERSEHFMKQFEKAKIYFLISYSERKTQNPFSPYFDWEQHHFFFLLFPYFFWFIVSTFSQWKWYNASRGVNAFPNCDEEKVFHKERSRISSTWTGLCIFLLSSSSDTLFLLSPLTYSSLISFEHSLFS